MTQVRDKFLSSIADQVGELLTDPENRKRFKTNLRRFKKQMDAYHAERSKVDPSADDSDLDDDTAAKPPASPLTFGLQGKDGLPCCYAWMMVVCNYKRNCNAVSDPLSGILSYHAKTIEYLIENDNCLAVNKDIITGALDKVRLDLSAEAKGKAGDGYKLTAEQKALGYLAKNPGATVAEVAHETGVSRQHLYRLPMFRGARKMLKQTGNDEIANGSRYKGNIEAIEERHLNQLPKSYLNDDAGD